MPHRQDTGEKTLKTQECKQRRHVPPLLKLALGVGAAMALKAIVRNRRAMDLHGKVVLITGGSRGLGLALAREFALEGARIALCARDHDELERAKRDLVGQGADVFTMPCDLRDRKQIEDTVLAVQMHFGTIDVLVNNAGIIQVGPMETMTHDDYEEAMTTHFWAPLHATLAALPEMGRKKSGRIVNIASIGGKTSVPHMLPYSASKFALVGLSEGLRAELVKHGIYVTTVCPGLVRSGSHLHATFKGQHRKEYTMFTLAGTTPGFSQSADRVARQIVAACKNGDAELLPGLPAKIGTAVHGLFPGLTADLWSVVNRALPKPGGIGTSKVEGKDSQSDMSPSWLTASIERAAVKNNQLD